MPKALSKKKEGFFVQRIRASFKTVFPNPPSPFQSQKARLRSFYNKKLDQLSSSQRKKKQEKINQFLSQLSLWKEARYIACYKALKDEACISYFCSLWKEKACFPVIQSNTLAFYKDEGRWQKGPSKNSEPVPEKGNQVSIDEISVFLLPGRVFDRSGGRLGRGRGYYDKLLGALKPGNQQAYLRKRLEPSHSNQALNFLKSHVQNKTESQSFKTHLKPKVLFLGVAFVEQIHNKDLDLDSHDVFMDVLVTDQFILWPLSRKVKTF